MHSIVVVWWDSLVMQMLCNWLVFILAFVSTQPCLCCRTVFALLTWFSQMMRSCLFSSSSCQKWSYVGCQAQNNSLVSLPEDLCHCSQMTSLNIEVWPWPIFLLIILNEFTLLVFSICFDQSFLMETNSSVYIKSLCHHHNNPCCFFTWYWKGYHHEMLWQGNRITDLTESLFSGFPNLTELDAGIWKFGRVVFAVKSAFLWNQPFGLYMRLKVHDDVKWYTSRCTSKWLSIVEQFYYAGGLVLWLCMTYMWTVV